MKTFMKRDLFDFVCLAAVVAIAIWATQFI